MFVFISLVFTGLLALGLLHGEGLLNNRIRLAVSVALLALILFLRSSMYDYVSGDVRDFILPWIDYLHDNGGLAGLGRYTGNYNPPYMYLLALISYFDEGLRLYLVKTVSVVSDVLLAWACMRLTSTVTDKPLRLLGVFFAVLMLPSAALNSAYWGQCDSIYTFFGVLAIYLALSDRPVGSMCALAASLAFKLQAVFIMPLFFILLLTRHIRPVHLLVFPAAYTVYMLPAVIAGKPFAETVLLYFSQAGTVGDALNYNAPSLTAIMWGAQGEKLPSLLIAAAFVFLLLLYLICACCRKSTGNAAIICFAVIIAVGIPFLLPHMHDRYFYPAVVLSLVLAFSCPMSFPVPVLLELGTLLCYSAYFSGKYLIHPRWGGISTLTALTVCLAVLFGLLGNKNCRSFEKGA